MITILTVIILASLTAFFLRKPQNSDIEVYTEDTQISELLNVFDLNEDSNINISVFTTFVDSYQTKDMTIDFTHDSKVGIEDFKKFADAYKEYRNYLNDNPDVTPEVSPDVTPTPIPDVSTTPEVSPAVTPVISPTVTPQASTPATVTPSPTPKPTPTPIITPTPTPIVVSSFPQIHGFGVPWQSTMLGNKKYSSESTIFNLSNVQSFIGNHRIVVYNWQTGSAGECLINTDKITYLPMAWNPSAAIPSECSGRPLLVGNECEDPHQCNKAASVVADGWVKHENWPGKIAICGNLIQSPTGDLNLGYQHCVDTFAAYKAKTGRDVPPAAKWIHLHAYWYVSDFNDSEKEKMKKQLQRWKALADSKGLKIIVSEWGLPFVEKERGKGPLQRQEQVIFETLQPELMLYFSFHIDWHNTQLVDASGNPTSIGTVWQTQFVGKR